jgi:U3 small nucleolar RNA-associated protein 21
MHPSTYLNKVLIGSIEGPLQLLNIRTLQCIYTFPGWSSEVTCMAQSPAVDVVAIGTADGCIRLHHLKFDQTLMTFTQAKDGRVTALSFRTDDRAPWLASGATTGDVHVWNLETQRLEQTIQRAHEAAIASAIFLPSEPVLVTSANDNAIQCWLFEGTSSSSCSSSSFSSLESSNARLLKSRRGHQLPPTRIRYYGNAQFMHRQDGTACQILSAGQDRSFRLFHTARTQQSAELSQGHIAKKAKKLHVSETSLKLPPILAFDAHEAREKDWANIVTCHEHAIPAYVWTLDRRTIEAKKVLQQVEGVVEPGSADDLRRQSSKATAVAIR